MNAVKEKILRGERLRVLFLNDIGFQNGAGIANLRQVQSFLKLGHEVVGICLYQEIVNIPFVPPGTRGIWLGMREYPHLVGGTKQNDERVISSITKETESLKPDLVIVGNIHGAKWPLCLIPALKASGCLVVAYMHDCYLISGRCAQPGDCRLFLTGCDESCPTANEYPALSPEKIPEAWKERRQIFCGRGAIPIACNSYWTLSMARNALEGLGFAEVVYLGLDKRLFSPIDRSLARRMLGIPEDRFVILSGGVYVHLPLKGLHIYREVVSALSRNMDFWIFGEGASDLNDVMATGMIGDYRKLPLLYSAADLFLGTSLAESFGQTFCEAAACGLPIVAFKVGGIPEIARHNCNARLVDSISAEGLIREIEFLYENPPVRYSLGVCGREIVEKEFDLDAQANGWSKYLKMLATSEVLS